MTASKASRIARDASVPISLPVPKNCGTNLGNSVYRFLRLIPDALPQRRVLTRLRDPGKDRMANRFKVGDHVRWNSEAGYVTGRIIKLHTRDTKYKGHPRHASSAEPQYEIRSDKTEHIAMHKGSALRKIR